MTTTTTAAAATIIATTITTTPAATVEMLSLLTLLKAPTKADLAKLETAKKQ